MVVALVLVIGLGRLIVFPFMKQSQTAVRDVSYGHAARTDRVVAVAADLESVLDESLDDLHPGREE